MADQYSKNSDSQSSPDTSLSQADKNKFLSRYEVLTEKSLNLASSGGLSNHEANELGALRRLLSAEEDSAVQKRLNDANKKAALNVKKQRSAARKNTLRAADDIADAATKLAFDKEKKPNLTIASMCFMRANLPEFVLASYRKKPSGWGTFTCIHDDGTATIPFGSGINGYHGIYNDKNKIETLVEFLNIKNDQYTILKPKAKISKIFINKQGRITNEVEINFPSDGAERIATEMLSSDTSDAGLKRVRVDFKNQNPFAAGRMVDVEIEIFLNGGKAFTRERGFSYNASSEEVINTRGYSIKDLVMRSNQLDPERYDGEHYGLKLEIGYEKPQTFGGVNFSSKMLKSIEQNTIPMILQLVEYDLNFQQNGTMSLILQYKGRIETSFENKEKYDIFDFQGYSRESVLRAGTAIGDEQKRYDQINNDLATAKDQLKALHSEEIFRSRNGTYEAGSLARNGGFAVSVIPIFGAAALLGNEVGYADEIAHYLENEEAMEKLPDNKRNKLNEIKKLLKDLDSSNEKITELERNFSILKRENKVLKYSRILEQMYANKKIYYRVIEIDDLVTYGPEFEASLKRKLEIVQADTNKSETEKEEYQAAVNSIIYNSRKEENKETKRQIARQTLLPSSNLIDSVKTAIRDKASEIAKKETGDENAVATEDTYKQAITQVEISNLLHPVSDHAPPAGTPDSDESLKNRKRIYYFFFGDLLDTVLRLNPDYDATIYNQMEIDKSGIILGPAYVELESKTIYPVNIADIPIPVDLYQDFFYKNIVQKDLDNYNLHQFVKDALNQLVAVALNQKCAGISVPAPVSVQATTLNLSSNYNQVWLQAFSERQLEAGKNVKGSYESLEFVTNCPLRNLLNVNRHHDYEKSSANSNRIKLDRRAIKELSALRNIAANSRANDIWSYIAYSLEPSGFKRQLAGNFREDASKGIHHLFVGKDRGLVKSINFRKNKKPGITTMMVERALERGEEDIELWAIFDLEIKMIGTSIFKPGMHIFLNPTIPGFGHPADKNSLSRTLGLGGYYLITSVTNDLVPGWETTINAKWTSYPISPSDSTYNVVDILQQDGISVEALDKVALVGGLGERSLGTAGTVEHRPASTTGKEAEVAAPPTTQQLLEKARKSLEGTPALGLMDQLSKTSQLQKTVEQQYKSRYEATKGTEAQFKYGSGTSLANPGMENMGAKEFLEQYQDAYNTRIGPTQPRPLESVQSATAGDPYGDASEYARAKTLTFQDGSGRMLTGFFYGYEGENLKNSEIFVLISGQEERIASE